MKKWRVLTSGLVISAAVFAVAYAAIIKTYTPLSTDSVKISQKSGAYVDANWKFAVSNTGPCTGAAPTISGFGTNAAIVASSAGCTAEINTGTASINGTIILPAATDGWACNAQDITTTTNAVSAVKEISTTTNTAVVEVFNTNTAATNFVANDLVVATCSPF